MPGLFEEPSSNDEASKHTVSASSSGSGALPKGIVLDKDGKPCRTCTSSSAWLSMMKSSTSKKPSPNTANAHGSSGGGAGSFAASAVPAAAGTAAAGLSTHHTDCPPDVEELGHSSWTLLHSLTATYPAQPSASMQSTTKQFINLFSQLYPCWVCADDFQAWMAKPENALEPELQSQEKFGWWMCRAHNEVNRKLGKDEFDCNLWRERWKDGWKDGRCG